MALPVVRGLVDVHPTGVDGLGEAQIRPLFLQKDDAGVQPGDVILRVNNTDIPDVKAFNDAVTKLPPKKPVALLVRDENGTHFAIIRPDQE